MEKPGAIMLTRSYLLDRAIPVREYYRNRSRQLLPKFARADCYTVQNGNGERITYAVVSSGLTQR
jgi:hypothetical protein